MMYERVLLQTIKFDLQIEHPYPSLLKFGKALKGNPSTGLSMFISLEGSGCLCCQGNLFSLNGVQGWHSGESTRLPPMWPGFDSQIRRQM